MPHNIPLRRMVLYKHGIGYFTRRGTVEGRELALPFRADAVDDALKSLVAFSLDGGQVTGVHYETPENKAERFADIPLDLGDEHSFFDLLRGIRGTPVVLTLMGGRTAQGRVVGVEEHPQGREHGAMVVLRTGEASVEQIASDRIVQVRIEDEQVARNVEAFLDTSRSEEERRTVRIDLSKPGREVQVSYTAPSPVWRVSYRLVGETNGSERKALLQAWGIFDNRLGEDLQDVEVTLVAGQPVSFRYDLTSSVIPPRRIVHDEARVASGPVEFEATTAMPMEGDLGQDVAMRRMSVVPAIARSRSAPRYSAAREDLETSTLSTTLGRDLDELFEYRLGEVSVRRGESAMAPIGQHTSAYRRELIYNGAKLPSHPVVSLRLSNQTGLTLERGPVTIVEDGQYRGEAMLPFTKADGEIILAFAVELGITVREDRQETTVLTGIELAGAFLHIQQYVVSTTTYTLVNNTNEEQVVSIEQARQPHGEIADTRAPDETTADEYRWRVACPPRQATAFRIVERRPFSHNESVLDQSFATLSDYLENRFLDGETRQRLQRILDLRQRMHDLDESIEELRAERQEIGARQDRLRKNLGIAATNDGEVEIRLRSAEEFARTQDREAEIDREMGELKAERNAAEEELDAEVAAVA